MSSQRKGAMVVTSKQQQQEQEEEEMELRRGPWTLEEDDLLMNYIACHGEGRWNLLARCSGLKRTGKSCRLRWLNYLKPDIKRGNLTPEEQLLILELHSKWGNRWSRIAQHLPGRTDNEIKNYWRTRVQKQARQLRVDANSPVFRDAVRCYWMPRLLEKMAAGTTTTAHHNYYMEMEMELAAAPIHPASIGGGGMASASSSPIHGGSSSLQSHQPHDANNNNNNAASGGGGGGYQQRQSHHVVDPSPSTSTSGGSGSTSAALPPVPCFSELSWVDDQQYYGNGGLCDLGDGASGAFDSSAAAGLGGSLGLDGLDLGPADGAGSYSDSTLLDYLNSTCGTGSMTMMLGNGGGGSAVHDSCDDDGAYYGGPTTTWRTADDLYHQAAARKLGDHQWGGGI